MSHRSLTATFMLCSMLALAACSTGSGTHTQSYSPSSSHPSSAAVTSTFSSAPVSSHPSSPTGFGPPQPAVEVYFKLIAASNAAFRDPAHVSSTALDKYLAGGAKIEFDQALAAAKKQGIAYKGTPSTPRLKVVSSAINGSLPEVVLRDCGLESSSDPFVGYYVATGKPVPTSKPKVPPPYAKTIKMFQPGRKQWVITSLTTDATKTCTP